MSKLLDNIKRRRLIIDHIRHNYKDFIKAKATTLANQLILDEIQIRMRNENFSNKIIERTYIKSVDFIDSGTLRINIVSDFKAESGFKVALARELGTDNNKEGHKHWVAPRIKQALSWIYQGRRMFSPGHYVSGLKSLHIMEKTIEERKPVLIMKLQEEIDNWKKGLANTLNT